VTGDQATPVVIAVVSWNTRELLRRCLRSIEPEVTGGRARTWVVDNGSTDGSAQMVRDEFGRVTLLALSENLGFGASVNLVARETESRWIAIANADVELEPGALSALLQTAERDPRVGIVAPRLVLPDGTTQHSVYSFPTLAFTLALNLGLGSLSPQLADRLAFMGRWNPARARVVDWAIGAFLLIRREAWEAIGGFDEAHWMYAEDLDLGWRAAAAGWRTRFEPSATVHHHGSAATAQLWGEDRDVQWQRSTYAWMLRRRGVLLTRICALINTAGAAVRLALLTPPALLFGGDWRARWRVMRRWTRLHLDNLLASRAVLEAHREP
jgi:N-acetylglucosaminyl-diphospho-decaprenol L-rhamnosyltransferase